jgi:hypothetical protein
VASCAGDLLDTTIFTGGPPLRKRRKCAADKDL